MKKRIFSIALMLVLAVSVITPAFAAETVVTTEQELRTAIEGGGEIVLGSNIGMKEQLVVPANTTLDLNGYKLTIITSIGSGSGVIIDVGQTLTVTDRKYNESSPNGGKLYVNGYKAGISTSGATLIVNSGIIEATGQWATGIGGRDSEGYRDGGTVIINGGMVTAKGGCPGTYGGAGIGGMGESGNGGTIIINNGKVTATGGNYGAGIGGGGSAGTFDRGGNSGTITINGGTVKGTGGYGAYDIGDGAGLNSEDGSLSVIGGKLNLVKKGIRIATLSFKNCTVEGNGAGKYWGTYNATGKLIENTIIFDSRGGSKVSKITLPKGKEVTEPSKPQKKGYIFGGWYKDSRYKNKYDFKAKVTSNITLYAKWNKKNS